MKVAASAFRWLANQPG